ncbi:carboxyl transferase domain-containing protein [uncultured Ilumatobacter sp.]|jgi:acetyl-CoA carboxylase carboxyltransferase component|uniref:carboxyl transferase domain-containing protein n=1 Tax=uncultured Ilumatobacter sp. TaxID=879968 RepID=UPI00374ED0F9
MSVEVSTELQGTLVALLVGAGDPVRAGGVVALVESMKMHHEVLAPVDGVVDAVVAVEGSMLSPGDVVVTLGPPIAAAAGDALPPVDVSSASSLPKGLDRPDLAEVIDRHESGLDAARPDAVEKRRRRNRRTARENVADLVDEGSFIEYGPLVIAAQRRRRDVADLIAKTPADGLVGGIGDINGHLFADARTRKAIAVSYDYTVLAGTQGTQNHRKKDRLFELAEQLRIPLVFFTEGGGGRPGDTDGIGVSGLDCLAFLWFAQLSGTVPLIGVNAGYCFAGNAAILGCCDIVIATEDSNIGMGGPAMIEGGGLGVFEPTEIGPIEVQRANGVVDIVAVDEAEATMFAKRCVGYFQGTTAEWEAPDQTALRDVVPLDRLRAYDIRTVINGLFDIGSMTELRRDFGLGMVTAFARLEGRPVGVVANNPHHLAGAIDSDGADKAARFMQLCDAHGLPIITLCDTPGMMVGPDIEASALVRHCSRLFVTGANVSVPMITIVTRKAYGLGAQAMMGGSTKAPLACLSWPTGEFGGMGLEGAVRLGYSKELAAVASDAERDALFIEMVDRMYEHGKALSVATHFEIDDVIDPADSRRWLSTLLAAAPPARGDRPNIDTW